MTAIIKATILNCIRDRKNLIFMIFFPLFLVFLIGSATSNYFDKENNNVAIEDLSIYYIDEGDEKTKEVFNTFIDVVKGSKDLENIELKEIKENSNYLFDIEADGNIDEETIILCHSSGANIFVSGGYVFGHNNPELRIKKFKNILSNGKVE